MNRAVYLALAVAAVAKDSVERLALAPGDEVTVLVEATEAMIGK